MEKMTDKEVEAWVKATVAQVNSYGKLTGSINQVLPLERDAATAALQRVIDKVFSPEHKANDPENAGFRSFKSVLSRSCKSMNLRASIKKGVLSLEDVDLQQEKSDGNEEGAEGKEEDRAEDKDIESQVLEESIMVVLLNLPKPEVYDRIKKAMDKIDKAREQAKRY